MFSVRRFFCYDRPRLYSEYCKFSDTHCFVTLYVHQFIYYQKSRDCSDAAAASLLLLAVRTLEKLALNQDEDYRHNLPAAALSVPPHQEHLCRGFPLHLPLRSHLLLRCHHSGPLHPRVTRLVSVWELLEIKK